MVESSSFTARRSGAGLRSPIDSVVSEDLVGDGGLRGGSSGLVVIDSSGFRGDVGLEVRGVARFPGIA